MQNLTRQRAVAEGTTRNAAEAINAGRVLAQRRGAAPRGRWWRDARRRRLLALADLGAAAIATAVVAIPLTAAPWAFLTLPLWPLVAKLFGLYDHDHRALRHSTADEVPAILASLLVCTSIATGIFALSPSMTLSPGSVLLLFGAAFVLTIGLRSLTRWLWWKLTPPELVGVIGDRTVMATLRRKFELFREVHLELATELEIRKLDRGGKRTDELLAFANGVDRIVVAAEGVEAELIGELKALCRQFQVKLSVVSPLRGEALPSEPAVNLGDLPILEYNVWDRSRSTLLIKRLFDLFASSVGLLAFSPFALVIAIAIKLDSPGPVFFSQIRAGIGGRPFRMYKFRTMSADAESELEQLVDLDELDEPVFKLRDDPRITRAGKLLRRLSADEVPQLVNVLMGEMSIVGPRPEQVELVERYSEEEQVRLLIKPGVTGPMQVFGRGGLTFSERLAVEVDYIENASLGRDLRILVHTFPAVIRGTGAY